MSQDAHDSGIVALCQDGRHNLYAVTASGQVTSYKHYHLHQPRLESTQPWSMVQATPQPHFTVKDMVVSFSGRFALLTGECETRPKLGLVDLCPRPSGQDPAQTSCLAKGCVVQGQFRAWDLPRVGSGVPGLRKVRWIRGSDSRVCVLTTNNHFLVYNVSRDLEAPPCQDFVLWVGSGQPLCGLSGNESRVVDFDFGPATLWGCFSVFFLRSDGAVFVLCPLVPDGTWVPRTIQEQMNQSLRVHAIPGATEFMKRLRSEPGDENVEKQEPPRGLPGSYLGIDLDMASCELANDDSRQDFCPALQGPLNTECGSVADDEEWEACSIACSIDQSGLALVAVVTSAGRSYFHVVLDEILPEWSTIYARKSVCPCRPSNSHGGAHLIASCLLFNEEDLQLQIQEVVNKYGSYVCWGMESRPLCIQLPCIEKLTAENDTEKEATIIALMDGDKSLEMSRPLGLFFIADGVSFCLQDDKCGIEMLPLKPPEKDVFSMEGADFPATARSEKHSSGSSLSDLARTPTLSLFAPLRTDKRIDWEGINELAVFLESQIDTIQKCEKEVQDFEQYLDNRIRTGNDLVEGHNDKLKIWEELWTVLDTWPSKGSCQLINSLEELDLKSTKVLASGIAGTCAQSKKPMKNGSLSSPKNNQILDSSAVARATKENSLMILGVRELLATMQCS